MCASCMRVSMHECIFICMACLCSGVLSVGVCIQSVMHAVHVLYFWLVSLAPCVLCLISKSYEIMRETYDNGLVPWRTAFYMLDLGEPVF